MNKETLENIVKVMYNNGLAGSAFVLDDYIPEIMKHKEVDSRLDKRIEWTRLMLEGDISKDQSADFQWLLMHLISLKSGEFEGKFEGDLTH